MQNTFHFNLSGVQIRTDVDIDHVADRLAVKVQRRLAGYPG